MHVLEMERAYFVYNVRKTKIAVIFHNGWFINVLKHFIYHEFIK